MSQGQRQSTVEYNRSQQRKQDRWEREDAIENVIEACSRLLEKAGQTSTPSGTDHFATIENLIRGENTEHPGLLTLTSQQTSAPIYECGHLVEDPAKWNYDALLQFVKHPEQSDPSEPSWRQVIVRVFESLVAVAEGEQVVQSEYVSEADAIGFSTTLGVHKQRADIDFGDPVEGITRKLGALKHYYTGGTSGGKSSGAARQVEDYYMASRSTSGLDYKILDPVGLTTENVDAYDVPMHDSTLRNVRERHDRPPSWADTEEYLVDEYDLEDGDLKAWQSADDEDDLDGEIAERIDAVPEELLDLLDYRPEAEFLVPLTPDLENYELPYDTVEDEPVPRPFTIPASDLSEGLLAAVLAARLSSGQERTIRQAYRECDRLWDDWSLDHLSQVIEERDDLSDKDKESATRIIENLRSQGFIRTADDKHALDDEAWRDLFNSTDMITAINQTPVENKLSRYLIVAYLIDQIWTRRFRAHDQPNLVMWLREIHLYFPHREIRRKMDDAVQNVVEYGISQMNKIQRLPRDINTHVVADTQDPTDPEKSVRTRFNRYVVFGGSSSDIDSIFDWANQDSADVFKGTVGDKPGHAGIIKGCEPAIKSSRRWGISPVHLTPPSWHHHDKDEGPSGWEKRVRISREVDEMNEEELRIPTWNLKPPENEDTDEIEDELSDGEDDADDEDEDEQEGWTEAEKIRIQARQLKAHKGLTDREIAKEIPNNPETGRKYSRQTVWRWTEDIEEGSGQLVTSPYPS